MKKILVVLSLVFVSMISVQNSFAYIDNELNTDLWTLKYTETGTFETFGAKTVALNTAINSMEENDVIIVDVTTAISGGTGTIPINTYVTSVNFSGTGSVRLSLMTSPNTYITLDDADPLTYVFEEGANGYATSGAFTISIYNTVITTYQSTLTGVNVSNISSVLLNGVELQPEDYEIVGEVITVYDAQAGDTLTVNTSYIEEGDDVPLSPVIPIVMISILLGGLFVYIKTGRE